MLKSAEPLNCPVVPVGANADPFRSAIFVPWNLIMGRTFQSAGSGSFRTVIAVINGLCPEDSMAGI